MDNLFPAFSKDSRGPDAAPFPSDIDQLIDDAIAALDQGHTHLARSRLEQALKLSDEQFDVWHLLGVASLRDRALPQACAFFERALQIDPDVAMTHVSLGVALMELQEHARAALAFGKAVELDPAEPGAHLGHGMAQLALKQWESAAASLGLALEQQPDNAEAHFNRGNALLELRKFEDALVSYEKALGIQPDHVSALINRAHVFVALRRYEDAIRSCQRANVLQPDLPSSFTLLGDACLAMNGHAEALSSYEHALALQPGQFAPLVNSGIALLKLGRVNEAIQKLEQALAVEPAHATAMSNLAGALREAERWDEAWEHCNNALKIDPAHAGAHMNRGNILLDRGDVRAARDAFAKVVSLQPHDPDSQWSLGWCDLLMGDWDRGLPQLEWRWKKPGFTSAPRNFSKPLWLGREDLRGRTILLHAEQGLGDTVQFCRYVTQLSAMGARVLLEVPAPLYKLVGSLRGVTQVIVKGEGFLPPFDFHCPLMSLPLAMGASVTMKPAGAYLQADTALTRAWADRLGSPRTPRVGLVWSGNALHRNDRRRSLSAAALLHAIPAGMDLYSLQKDVRADDRPAMQQYGVADLSDDLHSFADTAALIEQMDVIVAVDTSVAHVAAALGKRTWILLTKMPDWRWLLERDDTPWYESVRLFRQSRWGQWDDVLSKLNQSLHMEVAQAPKGQLQ